VGEVAESKWLVLPPAYPRDKSAPSFADTSIYRLVKETLRKIVRTTD
jgi:hypothetical protein